MTIEIDRDGVCLIAEVQDDGPYYLVEDMRIVGSIFGREFTCEVPSKLYDRCRFELVAKYEQAKEHQYNEDCYERILDR